MKPKIKVAKPNEQVTVEKGSFENDKIRRVTLSHGVTINMGDFQSFRGDLSVELEVEKGDNVEKMLDEISEDIKERLSKEYLKYK